MDCFVYPCIYLSDVDPWTFTRLNFLANIPSQRRGAFHLAAGVVGDKFLQMIFMHVLLQLLLLLLLLLLEV